MSLQPGTSLGPYEIKESIGAGGMGEVYRARDAKLDRDVAIKVLPDSFAQDEDRLARFEQEARVVAALSHPNILAIYDFGSEDGHVFAVTELLEGETLGARLAHGALPQRKAIHYGVQIARGLAAAHEKGITHRDLKPENLFVTREGRIKILDFGLAKMEAGQLAAGDSESWAPTQMAGTEPGVVLGTVGYMSPEQVRGERADHRSDLFAFGAIFYEMLAGGRAFQRDTSAETMTAILKEDPTELKEVSPALERIVHRCLEKNPGERFQSASDLAFTIESISRESGAVRVEPASGKPKALLIGAAAAVLLLVGVAYWLGQSTVAPGTAELPTYERLTFRRGIVYSARFDPGGRGVIYSAAWDGGEPEIYATLSGTRTSRALGLAPAEVLGVSSRGEIALLSKEKLMNWEFWDDPGGTLALSTTSGGAKRDIAEGVVHGDWTADGEEMVIVREVGSGFQVELPIGTVLYETTNIIEPPRTSPGGALVAFGEKAPGFVSNWFIVFLDRDGETRRFDTGFRGDLMDLAWSPSGDEVWFGIHQGGDPNLHAMSRDGRTRLLARTSIQLRMLDVASDGRVLVARLNHRVGARGVPPGETGERDLTWLDSTEVGAISGDGKTLVLTEYGEGGGEAWSIYLRQSDASPAVLLGEGQAYDLSPDGNWVLALRQGDPVTLELVPTGAGTPVLIETPGIVDVVTASFVVDEKQIVFAGVEKDAAPRWFHQMVGTGTRRPITDEHAIFEAYDIVSKPVSRDGSMLAAAKNGVIALYPLDGGEPRLLDDVPASMKVLQFTSDGRFLYVKEIVERTARVHRVETQSGQRELWKVITPPDTAALEDIYGIAISDDGESYYYSFVQKYSDLFLVEGLR